MKSNRRRKKNTTKRGCKGASPLKPTTTVLEKKKSKRIKQKKPLTRVCPEITPPPWTNSTLSIAKNVSWRISGTIPVTEISRAIENRHKPHWWSSNPPAYPNPRPEDTLALHQHTDLKKQQRKVKQRTISEGDGRWLPETQTLRDLKWTSDDHSGHPELHQPPRNKHLERG